MKLHFPPQPCPTFSLIGQQSWMDRLRPNHSYAHSVQVNGEQRADVVMVGTAANSLFALDASNGAVLWKRNFGPTTPNNWAIPDGFRYRSSAGHRSRAWDASTPFRQTAPSILFNLNDGTDVYTALNLITNPATNSVWGGLNKIGNSVYALPGVTVAMSLHGAVRLQGRRHGSTKL